MIELLLTYLMHCTPWHECDIEPPKVQQTESYRGIPKTRKKSVQCVQSGGTWDPEKKECKYS